ncbi:DNA-binding GntR family transcriptional regulator [Variovorax ginsengisoli]|uniref:DNA-binding GntR family transcriptional regulator n=2 Tax=Variovorax ginsengisoli TaxID=363844 RepID=A0ABT9S4P3_9BURK|nr:DNA-binding GntR family transcriptional regulator [Variovorax ginsengisoli]
MLKDHRYTAEATNMDLSKLVTPLTRQTLSGDVYKQLSELLMSGRVMPGEQLSLRTIAEGLGVSVMPVREAVHRLLSEKALVLLPNRVLKVPMMTVSQFREITSIRIHLESLAVSQAAQLMDDRALAEIRNAHERFSKEIAIKKPDVSSLIAINKELHFAIYRQARMPMLLEMIESLWLRIGPILNYDFRSGSARVTEHVSAFHHQRIVDALGRRDAAGAAQALAGDLQGASDFIVSAGVLLSDDPVAGTAPAASARTTAKRSPAGSAGAKRRNIPASLKTR